MRARATRRIVAGAVHALDAIASHPRHRVLFALVAGLLLGPLDRGALLVAAVAGAALTAAAVRRPGAAAAIALAVLAGGVIASERVAAFEHGALAWMRGNAVAGRVVLLEPLRDRGFGSAAARVRLLGGPARGEQVVLRLRWAMLHGAVPRVGDVLAVRGVVERLSRWEAYQHRRGALAAIESEAVRATGARRGGLAGALDSARRRAEAGFDRGLRAPEAAL